MGIPSTCLITELLLECRRQVRLAAHGLPMVGRFEAGCERGASSWGAAAQVGSKRVNVMMAQKRQASAGEGTPGARGAGNPLQPQPLYHHELTNGVAQPVSIPPGMSFFPARGYALNGATYPQVITSRACPVFPQGGMRRRVPVIPRCCRSGSVVLPCPGVCAKRHHLPAGELQQGSLLHPALHLRTACMVELPGSRVS